MTDAPDPIAQPDETVVIEWGDGSRSAMTVERLIQWCERMGNGGTDFSNLAMPKWRAVGKLLRDREGLVAALREARLKLEAANEMTQFCHDHHDTALAVQRLVAERDALKAERDEARQLAEKFRRMSQRRVSDPTSYEPLPWESQP